MCADISEGPALKIAPYMSFGMSDYCYTRGKVRLARWVVGGQHKLRVEYGPREEILMADHDIFLTSRTD